MPRLKLKSLRTFLAIKRCQGTNSKLVVKQSRSSIYKLVHICATSGKAVNRNTAMGAYKTDEIETYTSRFGGKVLTDEKSHDFFNVPKLHPTHRWKRPLPISVPVPS